jgi:hypothetical protein
MKSAADLSAKNQNKSDTALRRIFRFNVVKCDDLEICFKTTALSLSALKFHTRYPCSIYIYICIRGIYIYIYMCVCARACLRVWAR